MLVLFRMKFILLSLQSDVSYNICRLVNPRKVDFVMDWIALFLKFLKKGILAYNKHE